jgi:hypothetical protein
METANILKQVMGIICKAYVKSKVVLICTGDANLTGRGLIPIPQVCVANDIIGSVLGSANCQNFSVTGTDLSVDTHSSWLRITNNRP